MKQRPVEAQPSAVRHLLGPKKGKVQAPKIEGLLERGEGRLNATRADGRRKPRSTRATHKDGKADKGTDREQTMSGPDRRPTRYNRGA